MEGDIHLAFLSKECGNFEMKGQSTDTFSSNENAKQSKMMPIKVQKDAFHETFKLKSSRWKLHLLLPSIPNASLPRSIILPLIPSTTNHQYLDKSVSVQLNGSRSVSGVLRGYDVFMNVTLAEAIEHSQSEKLSLGTVVIRGNSIVSLEALDL